MANAAPVDRTELASLHRIDWSPLLFTLSNAQGLIYPCQQYRTNEVTPRDSENRLCNMWCSQSSLCSLLLRRSLLHTTSSRPNPRSSESYEDSRVAVFQLVSAMALSVATCLSMQPWVVRPQAAQTRRMGVGVGISTRSSTYHPAVDDGLKRRKHAEDHI